LEVEGGELAINPNVSAQVYAGFFFLRVIASSGARKMELEAESPFTDLHFRNANTNKSILVYQGGIGEEG
jgi:hypothetical protein